MDIPGYVAFPQKPEVLKTKPEGEKKQQHPFGNVLCFKG